MLVGGKAAGEASKAIGEASKAAGEASNGGCGASREHWESNAPFHTSLCFEDPRLPTENIPADAIGREVSMIFLALSCFITSLMYSVLSSLQGLISR